jgi:hypothetical protein
MNLHTWVGIAASIVALSSVATTNSREESRQESSSGVRVLWQFETGG